MFKEFGNISIKVGKFQMAWIGVVDEISKDVIPVAFAGEERGYLSKIKITLDESKPEGHGPTANAIREGTHFIINDFSTDPIVAPWKKEALERNFQSSLSIPIKKFGKHFGAVMFYSSLKNYFDDEEVKLLLEVSDNISFELENIETEKLKAEAEIKLMESEENYRTIVETASEGIWVLDANGNTNFVNQQMSEMLRFKIDELISRNVIEFTNDETKNFVQKNLTKIRNGAKQKFELKLNKKDGNYFWAFLSASPIYKNDIYNGVIALVQDITENKIAENKIRQSNRFYSFISHISEMIAVADSQDILFKESCEIAVKIGGFKMAWIGLLDEKAQKIIPVMHAGEEKGFLKIIKNISVNANEPEGQGPLGHAIRAGKFFYINDVEIGIKVPTWRTECIKRGFLSIMSIPLIKFGKTIGAFTVYAPVKDFFDESERELINKVTTNISFALEVIEKEKIRKIVEDNLYQSQKRYASLAEMSPVAIFHTDLEGNPTYVNPRWCEMTGIPIGEVSSARWSQILHHEDRETVIEKRKESIRLKKPFVAEFRIVHSDGKVRHVLTHVIQEKNLENEIVGFIGTITDITEIKQKKKELQDYRFALDQSSIVDVSDKNGIIQYANKNSTLISGYSLEELLNQDHKIFNSGYHDQEFYTNLRKTIYQGKVWRNEMRNKAKDGTYFWTDTTIVPVLDDSGNVQQFITIRSDITKRKENEEAIIESEEKYRGLSEATFDSIFISKNGICIEVNQTTEKMFGYTSKEAIGKHGTEFFAPEEKEKIGKIVSMNITEPYYATAMKKDGTQFPCMVRAKMVFYKGQHVRVTSLTDISDRIEAEKRYKDLFDLSPEPMWLYDLKSYKFIQVNLAAPKNYGYTNEEFMGMTIFDIRPEHEIANIKEHIEERNLLKLDSYRRKSFIRKKNGEEIEVEIFGAIIMLNGKRTGSVIAIDVTEKNRLEKEISKAILKTQEDERYEMGAELHDNISQIIVAGQLSLGMLKKGIDSSRMAMYMQCREYMDMALNEIRNLSHRMAPVFFEDKTLEDAIALLAGSMNVENKFKVKISFDDKVKRYPLSHDLQLSLYRIVQEQFKNIIKYSKATIVEIDLNLYYNVISLRVADNGVGFNVNTVKKGIGLANIKRRAELFSGEFQIKSSEGRGCIMTVDIPLKD